MSMQTLERAVLGELKQVTGISTLKMKDIQEWSTGVVIARAGETLVELPGLKVMCAVLTEAMQPKKRKARKV